MRSLLIYYGVITYKIILFPNHRIVYNISLHISRNHKYHRIIFGCQTIGKEDVLIRVARELKVKTSYLYDGL